MVSVCGGVSPHGSPSGPIQMGSTGTTAVALPVPCRGAPVWRRAVRADRSAQWHSRRARGYERALNGAMELQARLERLTTLEEQSYGVLADFVAMATRQQDELWSTVSVTAGQYRGHDLLARDWGVLEQIFRCYLQRWRADSLGYRPLARLELERLQNETLIARVGTDEHRWKEMRWKQRRKILWKRWRRVCRRKRRPKRRCEWKRASGGDRLRG